MTEIGEEGAVPTVSISEQGDGVAWLLKSVVLASPSDRKSPFIMPGLPEPAPDKIVSIPKLDPLAPSMAVIFYMRSTTLRGAAAAVTKRGKLSIIKQNRH